MPFSTMCAALLHIQSSRHVSIYLYQLVYLFSWISLLLSLASSSSSFNEWLWPLHFTFHCYHPNGQPSVIRALDYSPFSMGSPVTVAGRRGQFTGFNEFISSYLFTDVWMWFGSRGCSRVTVSWIKGEVNDKLVRNIIWLFGQLWVVIVTVIAWVSSSSWHPLVDFVCVQCP